MQPGLQTPASEGKCPSCSQAGPGLLGLPAARRRRPGSPQCQGQVGSDAGWEPKGDTGGKGWGAGHGGHDPRGADRSPWELGGQQPPTEPAWTASRAAEELGRRRASRVGSCAEGPQARDCPGAVWKEAQGLWGAQRSALTPTPVMVPSLSRWALWPGSGQGRQGAGPWSSWDASGLHQSWLPPSSCTCRASCCPMARRGLAL